MPSTPEPPPAPLPTTPKPLSGPPLPCTPVPAPTPRPWTPKTPLPRTPVPRLLVPATPTRLPGSASTADSLLVLARPVPAVAPVLSVPSRTGDPCAACAGPALSTACAASTPAPPAAPAISCRRVRPVPSCPASRLVPPAIAASHRGPWPPQAMVGSADRQRNVCNCSSCTPRALRQLVMSAVVNLAQAIEPKSRMYTPNDSSPCSSSVVSIGVRSSESNDSHQWVG